MDFFKVILGFVLVIVSSTCALNSTEIHDASNSSLAVGTSSGCDCSTYSCGCCEYINFIKVIGTVCTNASYLPNDYGFSLTLTFNNYTVINETISATNPPPICVGLPELEKVNAELCLVLSKLNWRNHEFSGCAAVKISVYHIIHKDFDIGCFHLPKRIRQTFDLDKMKEIEVVENHVDEYNEFDFEAIKKMPTVQII